MALCFEDKNKCKKYVWIHQHFWTNALFAIGTVIRHETVSSFILLKTNLCLRDVFKQSIDEFLRLLKQSNINVKENNFKKWRTFC